MALGTLKPSSFFPFDIDINDILNYCPNYLQGAIYFMLWGIFMGVTCFSVMIPSYDRGHI